MSEAMAGKTEAYFVYILLCMDGSYYTGYSHHPEKRFIQHKKGQGARYTRMYAPTKIVYLQKLQTRSAAMKREREIKTLNHEEKGILIATSYLEHRKS